MKRLLVGLLIVLVLLIAAVLIVPSVINWNDYRAEIAAQIEARTGREVSIDGDVSFTAIPSPALSVDGLRVANLPGATAEHFASLKSLEIEVALWPLLSGTVEVRRLVLVDPVVELEVLPDGRENWVFNQRETGAETATASGRAFDVSVDQFLMENGTIVYRDGPAPPQRFEGLNAAVSAQSLAGPFTVKGDMQLNDLPLALEVKVGNLDAARVPMDVRINVPDREAALAFSGVGTLPSQDGSTMQDYAVAGTLSLQAANPAALFAAEGAGEGHGPLSAPLSLEGRATAAGNRVALDDLNVSLGDIGGKGAVSYDFGNAPAFKVLLNLNAVNLDALFPAPDNADDGDSSDEDGADAVALSLPGDLRGDVELTADVLTYNDGAIRQMRATASVQDGAVSLTSMTALLPGGSDLAFSGQGTPGDGGLSFGGKLRLGSANPKALLAWLGVDASGFPDDRMTQLALEAVVTAQGDVLQMHDLDLQLDTSRITGGIGYVLQERPSFSAALAIDRLPLDPYLQTDTEAATDWRESLAVLNDFDTRLQITAGRLIVDQRPITDVVMDVELVGGALQITRLSAADLMGATVSLSGTAGGFDDRLTWNVSGDIAAAQGGDVLAALGMDAPSPAAGQAPLSLTLASRGGVAASTLSAEGTLGTTAFSIAGDGENWDQDDRQVQVRFSVQNPSWAALTRQVDVAAVTPLEGADGPVALEGTIAGAGADYDLTLTLDAVGGRIAVTGPVTGLGAGTDTVPGIDLAIVAESADPITFLRGLGVDFSPPRDGLGALRLNGRVDGSTEVLSVSDLRAEIGAAVLTGSLSYDQTGARPRFNAVIDAGSLNLDQFLPPAETGAVAAKETGGARWSREPFDFAAWQNMDGTIRFKADEFQVRRYQFDALDLGASLIGGRLELTNLSGFLFGGAMNATGVFDVSAMPSLSLTLNLNEASVAQALAATADQQTATGTFVLNGQVTAAGENQFAMISALDGRLDFNARDGVVRGFDIGRLSQEVAALLSGTGALEAIGDASRVYDIYLEEGETPYTRITAAFQIESGVAVARGARAGLTASEAVVNATLDLPAWTMDADLVFRLTGLAHANTPPVGTRVYGPIDAPRNETRTSALTQYVSTKLADRVLKDVFSVEGTGDTALRRLLGGPPQGETGNQQGGGQNQQQPSQPQNQQPANPLDLIFRGIVDRVREDRR